MAKEDYNFTPEKFAVLTGISETFNIDEGTCLKTAKESINLTM
jgi:hypothetical protein